MNANRKKLHKVLTETLFEITNQIEKIELSEKNATRLLIHYKQLTYYLKIRDDLEEACGPF